MRYKILPIAAFLFAFLQLHAQRANRVFAVTGDKTGGNPFLWTNICELDAQTGQLIRPLYAHLKTPFELYDGATKKMRMGSLPESDQRLLAIPQQPVSYLVAAAAYDVRHNRLFLAPMQQAELRWINLDEKSATVKIYTLPIPLQEADLLKEPGQLTRMVIAADGYGYALTNDANHLIRFSTGATPVVEDLGALQDDAGNGLISIRVKNASFGGDMIADADGNLWLFSAYHAVFKIDVTGKKAVYTSFIRNLPDEYTVNGAAVNEAGDLVIASANPNPKAGGYYKVDLKTWEAVKLTGNNATESVSDLASSNIAFQKKTVIAAAPAARISVYPNPLVQAAFHVNFTNKAAGRYTVLLMDAAGKPALQQQVDLLYKNQSATINIPGGTAKGIYLVSVVAADGKPAYTGKLLVN